MEKYTYRPAKFYVIIFACTWFWWLFAIISDEYIAEKYMELLPPEGQIMLEFYLKDQMSN